MEIGRTTPIVTRWPGRWSAGALLVAMVSPSLVWIALDRSVWPFDQAWYGQVSLTLFYTLIRDPAGWLPAMV